MKGVSDFNPLSRHRFQANLNFGYRFSKSNMVKSLPPLHCCFVVLHAQMHGSAHTMRLVECDYEIG